MLVNGELEFGLVVREWSEHAGWVGPGCCPHLQARDEVCRLQEGQLANLVDDGRDLGVDGGIGRVVPPRHALLLLEEGARGGADRGSTELAGAALRCVPAGQRHGGRYSVRGGAGNGGYRPVGTSGGRTGLAMGCLLLS